MSLGILWIDTVLLFYY